MFHECKRPLLVGVCELGIHNIAAGALGAACAGAACAGATTWRRSIGPWSCSSISSSTLFRHTPVRSAMQGNRISLLWPSLRCPSTQKAQLANEVCPSVHEAHLHMNMHEARKGVNRIARTNARANIHTRAQISLHRLTLYMASPMAIVSVLKDSIACFMAFVSSFAEASLRLEIEASTFDFTSAGILSPSSFSCFSVWYTKLSACGKYKGHWALHPVAGIDMTR